MLRVVEMACRQCRPTRIIHGQSILCKRSEPQKIGSQSLSVSTVFQILKSPNRFGFRQIFPTKKKNSAKDARFPGLLISQRKTSGWMASMLGAMLAWGLPWVGDELEILRVYDGLCDFCWGNGVLLKCMLHMFGSCFHTFGICAICQQLPFFVHFNPAQRTWPHHIPNDSQRSIVDWKNDHPGSRQNCYHWRLQRRVQELSKQFDAWRKDTRAEAAAWHDQTFTPCGLLNARRL